MNKRIYKYIFKLFGQYEEYNYHKLTYDYINETFKHDNINDELTLIFYKLILTYHINDIYNFDDICKHILKPGYSIYNVNKIYECIYFALITRFTKNKLRYISYTNDISLLSNILGRLFMDNSSILLMIVNILHDDNYKNLSNKSIEHLRAVLINMKNANKAISIILRQNSYLIPEVNKQYIDESYEF